MGLEGEDLTPSAPQNGGGREADYNFHDAPGMRTTTPVVPRATGRGRGRVPHPINRPHREAKASQPLLPPSCGVPVAIRRHPPPSAGPAAARPPGLRAASPPRHEGQVAQEAHAQAEAQAEEDEAEIQVTAASRAGRGPGAFGPRGCRCAVNKAGGDSERVVPAAGSGEGVLGRPRRTAHDVTALRQSPRVSSFRTAPEAP
ncbi:uncharacterized protein LOC133264224 [Pezoporus flaviventris]|uniref:uncharacterized protein LOC133264224 n=1 Tax=Pezoporus flaviventris TaxID=889875 RepID=UPI002AB0F21E|nr:uncharacterized protein LOC133264224 [Pezoporus flaviventris]